MAHLCFVVEAAAEEQRRLCVPPPHQLGHDEPRAVVYTEFRHVLDAHDLQAHARAEAATAQTEEGSGRTGMPGAIVSSNGGRPAGQKTFSWSGPKPVPGSQPQSPAAHDGPPQPTTQAAHTETGPTALRTRVVDRVRRLHDRAADELLGKITVDLGRRLAVRRQDRPGLPPTTARGSAGRPGRACCSAGRFAHQSKYEYSTKPSMDSLSIPIFARCTSTVSSRPSYTQPGSSGPASITKHLGRCSTPPPPGSGPSVVSFSFVVLPSATRPSHTA